MSNHYPYAKIVNFLVIPHYCDNLFSCNHGNMYKNIRFFVMMKSFFGVMMIIQLRYKNAINKVK
ncbi:hypothetical protein GGR21_001366 [Dysgonomonas hofstadii]|uniref:Uncharacterized protein n=1 Tax=Dysgonomonas hofstadii TaxID=637886 RepID=A0A840CUP8_9BACT|nr:hypothetical protein [Dysgonomonas hofstadii]